MNNSNQIKSKSFHSLTLFSFYLWIYLGLTPSSNAQISINTIVALSDCGIFIQVDGPEIASALPYSVKFFKDNLLVTETANIYPQGDNCFTIPQPSHRRFDVLLTDALGRICEVNDFQIGEQNPIIKEITREIPKGHCADFFGDCLDDSGYYRKVLPSYYGCDSTIILKLIVLGDLEVIFNTSNTPCSQQLGTVSAEVLGGFSPYSYQWSNGSTTNITNNLGAGTYEVTVTDDRGQMIIADVTVENEPVYHVREPVKNCFGDPLEIGGKNYSGQTSGIYSDTLQTVGGCDSIVSFELTVYDLKTVITQDNGTCIGNTGTAEIQATGGIAPYSYHWSDQSNPTTNNTRTNIGIGNYEVTIQDNFGCELTQELEFVYQTPSDTIIENICSGSAYFFNGEAFEQPGTYERTVFDQQGCPTTIILILDVINTDFSYNPTHSDCAANNGSINITISNQSIYRFNWSSGHETADISGLSPGNYTLSLTNTLTNCTSIEMIEIENLDAPFSIELFPINEDCGSGNGQLSARIEGSIDPSYTWRDENNNILGTTPSIDNLSKGVYSVEVKDNVGCIATKDTFLTSIDFNELVLDTTICEGTCFTIGTACYDKTSAYTHTITNSFGCDSTVFLNLQVHQLIVDIDYKHSDCGANNGTATTSIVQSHHGGPYSYHWTSKNLNQTIQGPTLNNLAPGVYYLRVNDGVTKDGYACTISDSIVIENLPIDSTFINICEGDCMVIGTTEYCEPGFYRDTLMATSGCDSIVVLSIDKAIFYPNNCTIEFSNPCSSEVSLEACQPAETIGYWSAIDDGIQFETPNNSRTWAYDLLEEENIIIWNLEKGACTLADTAVVFYEGTPVAVEDYFELSYKADTILNVLANDELYNAPTEIALFTQNSSLTVVNDTTLQYRAPQGFFGLDTLSYMVCNMHCINDVSARNIGTENCDSAAIIVKVFPFQTENPLPDILTPNGDGMNDEWIVDELLIHPEKYPENRLTIYNRWGNQVFHAKPYFNDWAGTNQKGQSLPESTYYYILHLDVGEGESYAGKILVNR